MKNIVKRGCLPIEPGSDFGPSVSLLEDNTIIYNAPENNDLNGNTVPDNAINRIYWYSKEEMKIFYPNEKSA